jgi:hypothetical protein
LQIKVVLVLELRLHLTVEQHCIECLAALPNVCSVRNVRNLGGMFEEPLLFVVLGREGQVDEGPEGYLVLPFACKLDVFEVVFGVLHSACVFLGLKTNTENGGTRGRFLSECKLGAPRCHHWPKLKACDNRGRMLKPKCFRKFGLRYHHLEAD